MERALRAEQRTFRAFSFYTSEEHIEAFLNCVRVNWEHAPGFQITIPVASCCGETLIKNNLLPQQGTGKPWVPGRVPATILMI